GHVTGVQTCALPIYPPRLNLENRYSIYKYEGPRVLPPDYFPSVHSCPEKSGLNNYESARADTPVAQLRGKTIGVERDSSSEKGSRLSQSIHSSVTCACRSCG